MKNNIVRITTALLLAVAVLSYLYWYRGWNKQRLEREPRHTAISCANNLGQIGLALNIWAGDHGGHFPFNISTNTGGTLELCAADKDGFDGNAYLFLRAMSNELDAPKCLICPLDQNKKPATDWAGLTASNITYRFRSGTNISKASLHEILLICPIDGNVLYSDGTIADKNGKAVERDPNALNVR